MPRKPIIRSNENYYHITARSNNKDFFELPIKCVWEIMIKRLKLLQIENQLRIASFVLMNNHFHLLILTPDKDIDKIMYFFMKQTTLEIQKSTGRINKIFGGRYKGCIIKNENYLLNVFKYISRNPVAAHLCEKAEDYPFSTLNYSINNKIFPLVLDDIILKDYFHNKMTLINWINQNFTEIESESVRCGLAKSIFAYKKDRLTNREIKPL